MMSQHAVHAQEEPGVRPIMFTWAMVVATAIGTAYVVTGPAGDIRELVSGLMGAGLTACLAVYGLGLVVDRAVARDRGVRAAQEAERERRADQERRVRDTARWVGSDNRELTIRWEPMEARYHVKGWMFDEWGVRNGITWRDAESLAAVMVEIEQAGMQPVDGEGMRTVRARLMMPGWDRPPLTPPDESGGWIDQPLLTPPDESGGWIDQPPLTPPMYPEPEAGPVMPTVPYEPPRYAEMPLEANETVEFALKPTFTRPWNAFEPAAPRPGLGDVIVPLPDRQAVLPCLTCSPPVRETVGMVCQTCKTDYGSTEGDECLTEVIDHVR